MGNQRKYTAKRLKKAVKEYFDSISREKQLTEKVDSGERDDKGHVIWREEPIVNKLGKPVTVTEFLVPPQIGGLSTYLGIHRSTWLEYSDHAKNPDLTDITDLANDIMHSWLNEQLVTRKDVKGITFELENNYGYKERRNVEVIGGVEQYLKRLAEMGEGAQEF